MTDQNTATEVIEFANTLRGLGLDVPYYTDRAAGSKCIWDEGDGGARATNSVANELIGIGLVGLAVAGDYYLRPVSNGRWIVREVFDPDLREWKGDSPLAVVVAACVACLPKKESKDG